MPRRVHVRQLQTGEVPLTREQSHHLRKVLRLGDGEAVELFDDLGQIAAGILKHVGAAGASVRVELVTAPGNRVFSLTIAAAVPKGERADWMIEKLSELGVDAFIPLAAARSVVLPEGRNKHERWVRIALESAQQSHRSGTMRIEKLTPINAAIQELAGSGWVCAMAQGRTPIEQAARNLPTSLTLFIGPEGGWTDEEMAAFAGAGIVPVQLTETILRVETAAIAAAAVVLMTRR